MGGGLSFPARTAAASGIAGRRDVLKGKILVTGGAGFLGRGLLRRAERESWPCEFTVYSRDETKQATVRARWPGTRCVLGDVRDRDRLESVMVGHDVVVHAAAIKYVPEAEFNVAEAIAVNVGGTENVARAAVRAGVGLVIGVSTDKACRPVNVYGMTKALGERLFTEAQGWGTTVFRTARYGNVVGSTGSVIPLFYRQLAETGAVSVTDPNMTRFWLSIDEAIDILLIDHDVPGAVVVPRCGAMRMGDLAAAIAGDGVRVVGIRPGEKQHEELLQFEESVRAVQHGNHYVLAPSGEKTGDEGFTYASHTPARWIDRERMLKMIEEGSDL